MIRVFSILATALLLLALPEVWGGAKAQSRPCMAHGDMAAWLAEDFAEQPLAAGLVSDKAVMEIFVSAAGTWSFVVTDRRGISCLMWAGEAWDAGMPAVEGEPS